MEGPVPATELTVMIFSECCFFMIGATALLQLVTEMNLLGTVYSRNDSAPFLDDPRPPSPRPPRDHGHRVRSRKQCHPPATVLSAVMSFASAWNSSYESRLRSATRDFGPNPARSFAYSRGIREHRDRPEQYNASFRSVASKSQVEPRLTATRKSVMRRWSQVRRLQANRQTQAKNHPNK